MTNCLVMPSTFIEVKDEEVEYIEGGITVELVLAIVGAAIATCGALYGGGYAIGQLCKNVYGANISGWNWWQKLLLQVGLTLLGGVCFSTGVMNGLCS